MYAVIKTGGKQYRVAEGDVLEVEHLSAKGDKATFTPVLVVTDDGKTIYGAKDLKSYSVAAKILGDAKGDKVQILKYRPKSGYTARAGHRQLYSLIEITSIAEKGKQSEKAEKAAPKAEKAEPKPETPEKSEAPVEGAEDATNG